jgi:uncharacterized membrane protein (UPF0127 family)
VRAWRAESRGLRRAGGWALAAVVALAACGDGGSEASGGEQAAGPERWEPLVTFDTIAVAIETGTDTIRISAELADNDDRRQYGLMERPSLAEDHGMLFVYGDDVEPSGSFWMYRTRMPLDIAFLDGDGRIVAVMAMDPCTSPNPEYCRHYMPGVPYTGALEVTRGFLARHEVEVGDRVRVVGEEGPEPGPGTAGPTDAAGSAGAREGAGP